jgi:hypothetical protein
MADIPVRRPCQGRFLRAQDWLDRQLQYPFFGIQ